MGWGGLGCAITFSYTKLLRSSWFSCVQLHEMTDMSLRSPLSCKGGVDTSASWGGVGTGASGTRASGAGVVGRGGNNVLDTTLFMVHQHELTYIYPRCALLHTPWFMS